MKPYQDVIAACSDYNPDVITTKITESMDRLTLSMPLAVCPLIFLFLFYSRFGTLSLI